MKLKRFMVLILTVYFSFLLSVSALASDINQVVSIRTVANNAPAVFGYNYDWTTAKETTLYDLNENIVAYCFDFKNNSVNSKTLNLDGDIPETAYVIVNANTSGHPILMFGVFGVSPYFSEEFDRAYYLGTLEYYAKNGSTYKNLSTNNTVRYETLAELCATNTENTLSKSSEDFTAIRTAFLHPTNSVLQETTNGTKILSAANLQWQRGCAPTSIAMLISTRYPLLNTTNMINNLANAMGTVPSGGTEFANIVTGTRTYIQTANLLSPAICGWASTSSTNVPRYGIEYNTKYTYQTSINNDYPVGVYISSSTVATEGYPNGISAHMMAGIGYSFALSGDYIICYTTHVADGQVYFPLTDAGLRNHAWFMLIWE